MKKEYKCHNCGKKNEFDSDEVKRFVVRLIESVGRNEEDSRTAYIVAGGHCQAENKIKI